MAKNIVILFDGTSNEIQANRTNILRLYGTLAKTQDQLVYYEPGVGTFGGANVWSRRLRRAIEIWGMATGWGLDANVEGAYRFLVENYRRDADGERDRIYIFGFSRGAYTARVLAGFLHNFGLMERRNLNLLRYAYRAYKRIGEFDEDDGGDAFAEIRLHERILRPDRPPIRLLGLFDTVATVIESGRFGPRLRKHASTRYNHSVEAVRHAVAIDERRTMFRPQLWPEDQRFRHDRFDRATAVPQDAREVWFAGVHGDVGGGYPEAEAQLAKLVLAWMIDETGPMGLHYKSRTVDRLVLGRHDEGRYVKPEARGPAHDSMSWGWRLVEWLPQRKRAHSKRPALLGWTIPFAERRHIPEDARIHASVFERETRPVHLPSRYTVA